MLSRFSSLRFVAANVSKLAATRRTTTPTASNPLLHTSAACNRRRIEPPEIDRSELSDIGPYTMINPLNWNDRPVNEPTNPPRTDELIMTIGEPYEPDEPDEPEEYYESSNDEPTNRVAVFVAGCGHFDGSVNLEVMSLLLQLEIRGIQAHVYAPHRQELVYKTNHLTGSPTAFIMRPAKESRQMLRRRSLDRWDRFMYADLSLVQRYDAFFIPGGGGLLRDSLRVKMVNVIQRLSEFGVPIATTSNAAILLASALDAVKVTVGSPENRGYWAHEHAAQSVHRCNGQLIATSALGVAYDEYWNVFSTPGYLDHFASYSDIHDGIGNLINRAVPDY